MAETNTNISNAAVSDLTSAVKDYSIDQMQTDGISEGIDETTWINTNWTKQYGYYCQIPELKKAIDALGTWVCSKGITTDPETQIILENIKGFGKDNFINIIWNLFVTSKISGDSFAEIIKDENSNILINLKPLDPGSIKIIVNRKGIIKRYEQITKIGKKDAVITKFKPEEIFHLCNDRIADNIHGTSAVDACEWVILARNEAMSNWKTVLNRNIHPLKIWHLDTDDSAKISAFITKVENTVKDKENLFVPKGNVEVDIPQVSLQDPLNWITYLENFFYQAVGVPRVIATSENYTEASSKMGFLTFEPVYTKEQTLLEYNLWNQLYIKLLFNRPPSLMDNVQSDEAKNTVHTGFQPNDVTAGAGD